MAAPADPARIGRARKGDAAAFEALVEARVGPMTRTAMAILGRQDEALDAVQDALVIAWRELASLRDPAAFDAWLTRILVNRCKRGLRGVVRRRVREMPPDEVAASAHEPSSADARVSGIGERDALERAFGRLTIDERTILVLHHLDRRSVAGTTAVISAPANAVEARMLAARSSLDKAIAWENRLAPSSVGRVIGSDDALEATLRTRADRLDPDSSSVVMRRIHGELGARRSGGILGFLPIGDRAGSMSGLAGWGAAIAVAVLVTIVLGGRDIGGAGATPATPPANPPSIGTDAGGTAPRDPCASSTAPSGAPSAGAPSGAEVGDGASAEPPVDAGQPGDSCGP